MEAILGAVIVAAPIVIIIGLFTAPCGDAYCYIQQNLCWLGVLPKLWSIENMREASNKLSLSSFCIGVYVYTTMLPPCGVQYFTTQHQQHRVIEHRKNKVLISIKGSQKVGNPKSTISLILVPITFKHT